MSGACTSYAALAFALTLAACAAMLGSPGIAQAQLGCCQLSGSACTTTGLASLCAANSGTFFADRACQGGALCTRLRPRIAPRDPRIALPTANLPRRAPAERAPALIRPQPPKVVVPHGPRATFAPAITATPTATATPVPNTFGCCQIPNNVARTCASPVDAGTCLNAGGSFVQDGVCNESIGLCEIRPVPPPPLSFCGNGFVEPGEECERDSDCAQPAEACTERCQCAGGVEFWLRWTNYNDIDLTVIDPLGNVYVPHRNVNEDCSSATRAPEESIFLAPGQAPVGCYKVYAHFAKRCPRSGLVDTHLQVRLNVAGFKWTFQDVPGPQPGEFFATQFGFRQNCP